MTKRFSMIPSAAVFDRRLRRTDLAVLCALGTYANGDRECWPATTTLAKDINITTRAIRSCLRALETCDYLKTTHRPGHRSTYQIIGIAVVDPGSRSSGVGPNPGSTGSGGAEAGVPGTPEAGVPPNIPINKPTEHTDGVSAAPVEFDAFWKLYPSRRHHSNPKKPAQAKYEAAVKSGTPPEDIIRGAENYAAYIRQEGTEPRYVAQAQTWLGQERWAEYQTAIPPSEAAYGSDVIH